MNDSDLVAARNESIGVFIYNPEAPRGTPHIARHQEGDSHFMVQMKISEAMKLAVRSPYRAASLPVICMAGVARRPLRIAKAL
jgi:hypothetical protein